MECITCFSHCSCDAREAMGQCVEFLINQKVNQILEEKRVSRSHQLTEKQNLGCSHLSQLTNCQIEALV